MNTSKSKRNTNSSFLSNHDLLQNFRNKSFKMITRDPSVNQFKQIPKKVSLIQKKSYQNINKGNQQNDPFLSNRKKLNINSKGTTFRQKYNIQISGNQFYKIIKQLNFIYDQIKTDQIQLRMILNKNIRKIKQIFSSRGQNGANVNNVQKLQIQLKEKLQFLQNKVQDLSKKIFKYKKQNQVLTEKVQLYKKKIFTLQQKLHHSINLDQAKFSIKQQNINYQLTDQLEKYIRSSLLQTIDPTHLITTQTNNIKIKSKQHKIGQDQIQILKNIISTQEELINKQVVDFEADNDQFLKMLQVQALKIQQLVRQNQKNKDAKSTRDFSHQNKQHGIQSYSNSVRQKNNFSSVKQQHNMSSPYRISEFLGNVKKQKIKQSQFSICLY